MLTLALCAALQAAPAAQRPFPLVPSAPYGERSFHVAEPMSSTPMLAALERVVFTNVLVPTAAENEFVTLELERVHAIAPSAELWVDGQLVGGSADLEAGFSAWSGRLAGEPDSDVFLAFTSTGARGWIARAEGRTHLLSLPRAGSDWSAPELVWMHETDPLMQASIPTFACALDTSAAGVPAQALGGRATSTTSARYCYQAVESDYQYYALFNDLTAATNYLVSLWSAVSDRFVSASNCSIQIVYLGLYTTSNDPWTSGDSGAGSGAMLDEFRGAWGGNLPNGANLAHFDSGANLGGGVAYVSTLCSAYYGFAVSGNLFGGTPFPVPTKSALTWDFFVTAHEEGHNFGSLHTHDYCPPLDECYAGYCTNGGLCSIGTIMSYCHLCPGGMRNIDTVFHPTTGDLMANVIADSCLGRVPCAACNCIEPSIQSVVPASIPMLPADSTVEITGCNFTDLDSITVDGLTVDASTIAILDDERVTFALPRMERQGAVDIVATNGAGVGQAFSVVIDPPVEAVLEIEYYWPLFLRKSIGVPTNVFASPGDLVILAYSEELLPSILPGFVAFDIGNVFSSLFLADAYFMESDGVSEVTYSLATTPVFYHFYLQAVVRRGPAGTQPFQTTAWYEAFVVY
jgi:hypothetical protein